MLGREVKRAWEPGKPFYLFHAPTINGKGREFSQDSKVVYRASAIVSDVDSFVCGSSNAVGSVARGRRLKVNTAARLRFPFGPRGPSVLRGAEDFLGTLTTS